MTSFGVVAGDEVVLRWAHEQSVFYAPPHTKLTLHVRGQLAFSYTLAMDVPEGFSLEPGAEHCRGSDRCTEWVSESLIVRGPCGESVSVASGQRGSVCGYEVLPGSLKRVLEFIGDRRYGCADYWVKGTDLTLAGSGVQD